jgi:hypothetical protein
VDACHNLRRPLTAAIISEQRRQVRTSHHEAAVIVHANAAAAPEACASQAVTVPVTAVTKRNTAGSMTPLSGALTGLQARQWVLQVDLLNPTGFQVGPFEPVLHTVKTVKTVFAGVCRDLFFCDLMSFLLIRNQRDYNLQSANEEHRMGPNATHPS